MKKIRSFVYRILFLDKQLKELRREQRVLRAQFDHIISTGNKAVRWKWKRMLTNERSPFYVLKDFK